MSLKTTVKAALHRALRYPHVADDMATKHIARFEGTPGFAVAYARSVKAAGWDYRVPYRVHQALWCAAKARKVAGDVVELGTGRGFIMSAVLQAWPEWDRSLYLFDTYEPGHIAGTAHRAAGQSPYYAQSFEAVRDNFAEWPRVHLVRGDVFDTVPVTPIERVAFLHIDLNYYKPEIFGLRHFWPLIPEGGVVLFDDYACHGRERQYDAMNEAARELGFAILSTASGQGIVVK